MVSLGLMACLAWMTYAIAVGVVESFQLDDVGVSHDAHDLEFSVLRAVREVHVTEALEAIAKAHLESLVLENSLDRSILSRR
jgi:hypothetical protein